MYFQQCEQAYNGSRRFSYSVDYTKIYHAVEILILFEHQHEIHCVEPGSLIRLPSCGLYARIKPYSIECEWVGIQVWNNSLLNTHVHKYWRYTWQKIEQWTRPHRPCSTKEKPIEILENTQKLTHIYMGLSLSPLRYNSLKTAKLRIMRIS